MAAAGSWEPGLSEEGALSPQPQAQPWHSAIRAFSCLWIPGNGHGSVLGPNGCHKLGDHRQPHVRSSAF